MFWVLFLFNAGPDVMQGSFSCHRATRFRDAQVLGVYLYASEDCICKITIFFKKVNS